MVVRRDAYRPPAWLVPEVALDFELDPERTLVRTRLEAVRNGPHREPLRLDGLGLKLRSLRVDGKPASHKLDRHGLTIKIAADRAVVETVAELSPTAEQKGLFTLGEILCTQCEPEHFRRIAFFPDRPDVLSRFRVRIVADKARYPILLCNGELVGSGDLDGGRHWVEWHDPHPKPCYLFAIVAGALATRTARFVTRSGREVSLGVWASETDLPRTDHALEALAEAMAWDEAHYGREYDLSAYNIVALPGFAFGAMENKGLAIYDSSQVLIDPETATDSEREIAAALVAHEYFHNWSGNRVTCRDWFQMTLKEGFTVFRDQQFSAGRRFAGVRRIEDVRALRLAQFAEDAGPRAHAPRPESYADPAELLTATVYIKGAEIVRMIHTVLGPDRFRAGADLYFARHDGQGATCEDFVAAMEDASGIDLSAFLRWFDTSGTPEIAGTLDYDPTGRRASVSLSRRSPEPPVPVPLRLALFDAASGAKLSERLVVLEDAELDVSFDAVPARPVLSANRGFSAPVRIALTRSLADLAVLARHDDDPFARREAMQALMLAALRDPQADRSHLIAAMRKALTDPAPARDFVAELVTLVPEGLVADGEISLDPGRIHAAWMALRAEIGRALEPEWRVAQATTVDADREAAEAAGVRRLRGVALGYLLAGGAADAGALALLEVEHGATLTEREDALRALADSEAPEREAALAAFHRRYRADPRLLDKWFAIQALSARADTIDKAPKLLAHPDFTLAHPGRLGAIVGAFAANPHAFHDPSGRGYRFLADVILVLDRSDPAGATRMARSLEPWRRYEPTRSALMKAQLERIAGTSEASDTLRNWARACLA